MYAMSVVETPLKIDRKVSETGLQKRAGHSLPPKGGFMATFVTGYGLAAGAQFCNFNLHTHVYCVSLLSSQL